jgi:hypothetical protein
VVCCVAPFFLQMQVVLQSTNMYASEPIISYAPQYIKKHVKVCSLFMAHYLIIIATIIMF